jgi:5-hydroxyisourate hydrolase-like protein (transthyretin family)
MLTKMKIAIVLVGSLVAGAVGVAGAQGFSAATRGPDRAQVLQKYDTNKDGKLDDQEKATMKADFQAKREEMKKEMLAKYDTNKDGKLDQSEREVARKDKLAEEFKKLDTDGNGQLSLSEFQAAKFGGGHHGKFGRQGRMGHGHRGQGNLKTK